MTCFGVAQRDTAWHDVVKTGSVVKGFAWLAGAVVMICPPVPSLLSLHQPGQDGSDDQQSDSDSDSDSDRPVNLDESEDTR